MIKALIFDLDNTLIHSDKSISSYTREILDRCRNCGMALMIATGRPLRHVGDYFLPDALTAFNGGYIRSQSGVVKQFIEVSQAEQIIEKLCTFQIPFSVEMGNAVYSNMPVPEYESIIYSDFPKLPDGEAPYKILINRVDCETIAILKDILPENLYFTVSIGKMIQIMDRCASKWNGIQAMLAGAGIDISEAVYFGDDYDDIEPIKNCGIGVAVSNAIEEVKQSADYITRCL